MKQASSNLQHKSTVVTSSHDQDFSSSSLAQDHSPSRSPICQSSLPLSAERAGAQQHLSRDNCDRTRPLEEDNTRLKKKMASDLMAKTVGPFLKEHIPGLYAPVGKGNNIEADSTSLSIPARIKDPNTKFCYRHSPDSKCRRAADESKMGFIQSELNSLPTADQEAITHVWSLFSAAPSKQRELMLQGIITQCCFPQLSTVSREVQEQLKIDFLAALPTELSYKILSYLDTVSLCKAAQVSRRWSSLADDDVVWHRMCEQHIDRKCTKCGWGLPLLEKKKLMAWNRHQSAHRRQDQEHNTNTEPSVETQSTAALTTSSGSPDGCVKRPRSSDGEASAKRPRLDAASHSRSHLDTERKFRPWKDVYRDRYKVGFNWKTGRCTIKTFKGHENGVTCLQFDHNILATGSYDTTIKIWDIETGEVIRTLRGHTSTVRTLQFDDSKLISGSFDKTIKIWNWQTGECLSTLQCHTDGVLSVHFDGCTLASGSIDRTVKIFSFKNKQTFSLRGHTDWVNHVRIDSSSRTVFSASDDMTVKLWDLDSKQCIRTFRGHVGQVQQVLLMPPDFEPDELPSEDKTDAVSVHSDRSTTPTLTPAGALVSTPEQPPDERASFGYGFTHNTDRPLPPRYMLTGGLDNTVRLWEVNTGKCIKSMFGHVEGIWGLVGDTLRVVTGANDSMTKIWEPRSGKCERSFTGHTGPVTCVGLSDSRMASGSEDGEVRLYSFEGETLEERGTPS
ncbi:E3 ubiquitin ligase complex SCF subunit scon-2 [Claviceps aff. purpurea]|uniref:E3 ubiquitin ligase complex SCF subunit scon-2 n=1 Tax=Claviceps aff. purpurea TaxID=1967640 RepID=A0A9P7QF77_9HYPO|nr:E3 ubiquitin ligase complex SCF subunit scon-2 [Claviceps purpurea]KAG6292307.1 E3 ubiquitin ligase complex SCF subunit scon-2 [Claviceps aff. purpurea]KAG6128749.1 E3 ubiquitin ligase complex SCF subunit scon-2 [Claviceps purpurea]KAG6147819.1 E3 ubiquitin ligase complex SCF subunit scon-2 [Claviceps purpurea]KAG6174944.1 E3 ubiquitin ligase complex SCF subunit scon-2 [Claviceps purpurea]